MDAGLLEQMLLGALLGLSVYLPLRCGQLSLATPGFFAIGGTVAALLSTRLPALAGSGSTYPITSVLLEMALAALLTGVLALGLMLIELHRRTKPGRSWAMIRAGETTALSAGVNLLL